MAIELRSPRADELAAIHRLHRRVEIADAIPIVTPADEFEEWLRDPHLSLADDARVATVDGELAGYGRLWHRPSDSGEARVFLLGAVDPARRGRGVGRALLAWQLARGREILRSAPPALPRFLRTQIYDFERSAIALYERAGLTPVRYFEEMIRPLEPGDAAPEPPGIALRRWDVGRSEELRAVHNEAFADLWGSSPLDRDAWAHRLDEHGNRLDLSWIAVDGDRIVGFALCGHFPDDEALIGRRDGWIRHLGVARDRRNRGVASALVLASCTTFAAAGFTHAALGVDSDSPTGAHRIYHRLGFRRLHRMVQHQLEV
jgi:mycothiol synthase